MPIAGTTPAGQDTQQQWSLTGLSGTLGPSYGTAEITPVTVTTDGKLRVESSANVSVGTIERVNTIGTLEVGTVTIGAVNSIGTIGTVQAGTLTQVTTVSNVTNGTIRVTAGTVTEGTLTLVTTVANLTNGTVRVTAGTINTGTINSGTINSGTINAGTINSGTINAGTFNLNAKPLRTLITIGSTWGTTSGTAGTLIAAAGAGTSIFINEFSISNDGTSTLGAGLSFGTPQTGTSVVKKLTMAGNGGIQVSPSIAIGGNAANTPLVMWTTGSGTASFNVSYWVEAQ